MERYLVGEVNGTLYWHQVDEKATAAMYESGDMELPEMCKTTHGLLFGSTTYSEIPADTTFAKYTP